MVEEMEVAMLCEELERLEAEFDDIVSAMEEPTLTEEDRQSLQKAYSRLSRVIEKHHKSGHQGEPCFEDSCSE